LVFPDRVDTSVADAELAEFLRVAANRAPVGSMSYSSSVTRWFERFPQLSQEAQGQLVAAYQAGMQLQEDLAAKRIPRHRIREARKRIAEMDQHLTYIAASNYRLVRVIAQELLTQRNPSRDRLAEMLDDLVNEGYYALVKAAATYDPTRGPKFQTYAAKMIRDQIRSVLGSDTPLTLTSAQQRASRIVRPMLPELAAKLGRAPKIEEIQDALLETCMEWADRRLTPEQRRLPADEQYRIKYERLTRQGMIAAITGIDKLLLLSQPMSRLDGQVGDDGGSTLADLVVDPMAHLDAETVRGPSLDELSDALARVLWDLCDERERDIILLRYGFLDEDKALVTFQEVADPFGVTPERIRQIDAAIRERLRDSDEHNSLRSHLPSGPAASGGSDAPPMSLNEMVEACRARLVAAGFLDG
jgi:RNA polymerase sigma factor (sigma-70 family)